MQEVSVGEAVEALTHIEASAKTIWDHAQISKETALLTIGQIKKKDCCYKETCAIVGREHVLIEMLVNQIREDTNLKRILRTALLFAE